MNEKKSPERNASTIPSRSHSEHYRVRFCIVCRLFRVAWHLYAFDATYVLHMNWKDIETSSMCRKISLRPTWGLHIASQPNMRPECSIVPVETSIPLDLAPHVVPPSVPEVCSIMGHPFGYHRKSGAFGIPSTLPTLYYASWCHKDRRWRKCSSRKKAPKSNLALVVESFGSDGETLEWCQCPWSQRFGRCLPWDRVAGDSQVYCCWIFLPSEIQQPANNGLQRLSMDRYNLRKMVPVRSDTLLTLSREVEPRFPKYRVISTRQYQRSLTGGRTPISLYRKPIRFMWESADASCMKSQIPLQLKTSFEPEYVHINLLYLVNSLNLWAFRSFGSVSVCWNASAMSSISDTASRCS